MKNLKNCKNIMGFSTESIQVVMQVSAFQHFKIEKTWATIYINNLTVCRRSQITIQR